MNKKKVCKHAGVRCSRGKQKQDIYFAIIHILWYNLKLPSKTFY